jgi:hypothetical protein
MGRLQYNKSEAEEKWQKSRLDDERRRFLTDFNVQLLCGVQNVGQNVRFAGEYLEI